MESVTKRKLDNQEIEGLIKAAFGEAKETQTIKELTDGYFNNSYHIQFKDGQETVLKISPQSHVKVLQYEKNLMETEVFVLKEITKLGGVPVPSIHYADHSRCLMDSDYFFMSYIEGMPLNKVREQLSQEQYVTLSSTLGSYARKINEIKGDYFGFINIASRRYDKWLPCFTQMMMDLMADAEVENVVLPITKAEVMNMINHHQEVFEAVETPTLVHKDLWDGNVFVDPKTFEIKSIIDCERAIYADPLLEVVCGFYVDNGAFLKAFLGRDLLNDQEQIRIKFYLFYLFLLMVVECPYRQYEDKGMEEWSRSMLATCIKELEESIPG